MRDRNSFESKMFTKDPKTKKAYNITLDAFEEYMKRNKLKIIHDMDVMEDVVQGFVNEMSTSHAPVSVWNYYSRVKKYLKHLRINIDEIELPPKAEKDLYPVKLYELHDIFRHMKPRDVTLFMTQLSGGLRIGEAVQLRKKHVSTKYDRVTIRIPSEIAKFKKARTAVLTKECGSRIMALIREKNDNDLIFGTCSNVHSAETNKQGILRNKLDAIGLDMKYEDTGRYMINSHSFRAFFITNVSRHDPNLAKKLAGQKGYLLQYDRLDVEGLVQHFKKCEPDLTIFDLARHKAELEESNRKNDIKNKNIRSEMDAMKAALTVLFNSKEIKDPKQKKIADEFARENHLVSLSSSEE